MRRGNWQLAVVVGTARGARRTGDVTSRAASAFAVAGGALRARTVSSGARTSFSVSTRGALATRVSGGAGWAFAALTTFAWSLRVAPITGTLCALATFSVAPRATALGRVGHDDIGPLCFAGLELKSFVTWVQG